MFRSAISVLRNLQPQRLIYYNTASIIRNEIRNYSAINIKPHLSGSTYLSKGLCYPSYVSNGSLIRNKQLLEISNTLTPPPIRSVTKFSLKRGKRKTVKAVIKRFYRLDWGCWIRTKCGRNKKLWKKSAQQKRRLRQHVFCNATQSNLLDKMVTKFWKKPKYYVDDVYAPYHTREEFHLTRKKPTVY